MGCGASKAPADSAVAPQPAAQEKTKQADAFRSEEPRERPGGLVPGPQPQPPSGLAAAPGGNKPSGPQHLSGDAGTEPGAGEAQVSAVFHIEATSSGNGRAPSMKPEAVAAVPETARLPSGRVTDAISAIVHEDDDVFDEGGTGAAPAGTADSLLLHNSNRQPERATSNPLSGPNHTMDQPTASVQPQQPNRLPSLEKGNRVQDRFSDIAGPRSELPGVESFSRRPLPTNWLAPSALDQLGTTSEGSGMQSSATATFPQHSTEVLELGASSGVGRVEDEEELDSFDAYAISSPKFNSPAPRGQPSPQDAILGQADASADPEDPWESLQQQYQIRENLKSPTSLQQPSTNGGSGKWNSSPLAANDEVLVLDEEAGLATAVAHPAARSKELGTKPAVPAAAARATRKEGNWGDGDMAQAGDLMLGYGALDSDPSRFMGQDDASFSGNGRHSSFSAEYVEYQQNDRSFDLSTLEVPPANGDNPLDIAMEDFNDELEIYGVKKEGKELSLADKLAQFESAVDDVGLDEDEYLINEELRLFAQNSP